jgi:NADPH-dependent 2,4-dienoyl-CoA reductase/sulfur reductase-like enzyme/nitrite reductase/ring-hydroxylating ferredoxin subunit
MNEARDAAAGRDLGLGVGFAELAHSGKIAGKVGGEDVLLVLAGEKLYAVGAQCTHYHAPLAEGLVVGAEIRCPWHHACFDLATGAAKRAPALDALACWEVERRGDEVFVRNKKPAPAPAPPLEAQQKFVIVGGGAAGLAAAVELRRLGFAGSVTMVSAESAAPIDRPNLSKDYLAGAAPEDWLPLRPDDFYRDNRIDLRLGAEVVELDTKAKQATLADGTALPYDRLLLATGAEPVRLPVPGADLPHVFVLRSLDDCRAIIEQAKTAKRAVVVGASFIGLEVSAALRAREIEVHVVAPEKIPMSRVLGPEMGAFVRSLHEEHGVRFHLEDKPESIDAAGVTLASGGRIEAELVVVGVGVRPRLALAERAGLAVDRGVVVNAQLETSAAGVYAAGDIARWPDPHSGAAIRVEHWVVAQRQGQTAARNMMGRAEVFDAVPFFWSQHYDTPINYLGHAESWDAIAMEGDLAARDCLLRYGRGGKTLAIASIFRDVENLSEEARMEGALG